MQECGTMGHRGDSSEKLKKARNKVYATNLHRAKNGMRQVTHHKAKKIIMNKLEVDRDQVQGDSSGDTAQGQGKDQCDGRGHGVIWQCPQQEGGRQYQGKPGAMWSSRHQGPNQLSWHITVGEIELPSGEAH